MSTTVPSRRTVLAGAFGISALSGVGLTPDVAAAAVGDVTIPSSPGIFYLKVPGVAGDVTNVDFANQIALLTWGWGAHNSSDPLAGGGGGGGKSAPEDLIVVAYSGSHTPRATGFVNNGKHIASAVLSCVTSGSKPVTFLKLTLDNVLVVSCYTTPDVTSGRPLDVIHFKYTQMTQAFFPQRPDGSSAPAVTTTWNYLTNSTS